MKIQKIKEALNEKQGALIIGDSNRKYLTGFSSSAGILFITKNSSKLFIDFRYYEKAKREVVNFDVVLSEKVINQLNEVINDEGITSVAIETDVMSVKEYGYYSENLGAKLCDDNILVDTLEKLRSIKDENELSCIKTAQKYTEKTFEYILGRIGVGRTEREIMLDMELFMRKLGSEGVAFDFIVVSGKNSSLPHGVPTDKPIQNGDFITMDFGARFKGYCSDMTRTVAVGTVSDEQKYVYDVVLKAQLEAIKAIKAGVICKDIDKIARDIIYNSGYNGCFGHGLGHSVGIDVHEYPSFNTRCEAVLQKGTVMTVEPGIYIQNKFGVRIEDMVYVTENGCDNLTSCPKDLIIL